MNPQAPDFGIQRNYLDLFLELPWNVYSKDNFDLKRAENLRSGSFWVRRGEKRMIEHLAVLKLRNDEVTNYMFDRTSRCG
jgi:ATP-dependent Lon protease